MILVTRFDGSTFYINAELIRSVEHTPDTVITLTNDYKVVIHESAEEVVNRVIEYQKKIHGYESLKSILLSNKEE